MILGSVGRLTITPIQNQNNVTVMHQYDTEPNCNRDQLSQHDAGL